jgi:hypothetical protein
MRQAEARQRMPPNPHVVGRIEESLIGTRSVADDSLQKSGVAAVATSHPMLAEKPDITGPRPGRCLQVGDRTARAREPRPHTVSAIGLICADGRTGSTSSS